MTKSRHRVAWMPLLALLAALFAVVPACAAPTWLRDETPMVNLAGRMEVLRDETGQLSIDDMARPDIAARFKPLADGLAGGYDSAAYWLRFEIVRDPGSAKRWLMEVEMPYLDHVGLFTPDDRGHFAVVKTGDRTPFTARPIPHRNFVFAPAFPTQPGQPSYLRVQSTSTLVANARIMTDDAFAAEASRDSLFLGLINGCMAAMIVFSLFQHLTRKDPIYLHFVGYIAAVSVMYLAINGLFIQWLPPNFHLLADAMVGFWVCVSTGLGMIFSAKVLGLQSSFPRFDKAYRVMGALKILAATSVAIDRYAVVAPIIHATVLLTLPITTALALILTLRGQRSARYFLASFLVYVAAAMLLILRGLGLIDGAPVNNLAAQFAAVPHMMLLVLGLMHRSAGIDRGLLQSAKESERELERRVAERAAELSETNAALAAEVAERRLAEERLRVSEREVRSILDAAPFPMLVAAYPEGGFLFLNQPALDLLNIGAEEAMAMATTDFYIDIEERQHFLMKLSETGCVLGVEMRVRRLPKDERWVLMSAVRFTYANRDAVLICLNDISTRKLLEESLRVAGLRSEAALEANYQAMREQRNFLSMVSHEFRVPLAIIEAASQLIGIYAEHDSEAQDEVAKISRASRRLSDLIDVCLADDRLDSNTMSLRVAEFDLASTLADIRDDKRPFAGKRHLTVSADRPAVIHADPTLLRVAFSNLIDNALKFSPPDSPVEVRIAPDQEGIMVSVSDQGPGIALDEQPRVFEKFYRSTKADRIRGAGLGLYIVRRIVDLHGGSIAVDSLPGRGATFVVWLPLSPAVSINTIT